MANFRFLTLIVYIYLDFYKGAFIFLQMHEEVLRTLFDISNFFNIILLFSSNNSAIK